jgi:hypothetical protein
MSKGRSAAIVAVVSLALLAGLTLVLPAAASADSGTGNIYTLPDSHELEASVQVEHTCKEGSCVWFAEASAYPPETACPESLDLSHSVWIGEVKDSPAGTWTDFGHFSFAPEESGAATVCLYVNAEGESSLAGSIERPAPSTEVTPAPTPTSLAVHVSHYDHGCRAHVTVSVVGEGPLADEVTVRLAGPRRHHLVAKPMLSGSSVSREVWAVVGPRGTYSLTATYPGSLLWGPARPVTARFHLGDC